MRPYYLNRIIIKIDNKPLNEGGFGRIAHCSYRDSTTEKRMVVKMIDEMNQIRVSAIEGVITSSLDHPHIVQSAYPPLVHHIKRKRLRDQVEREVTSKPVKTPLLRSKFKLFKNKLNLERVDEPPQSKSEFAPSEYDVDYRRLIIFQDEARGDLLHCPWIGQESSVITIAWQLLNALYALHRERVVHADVKPDNVLYYDMNRIDVRLGDFTIASILDPNGNTGNPGSPCYIAPEILAEERWDEKIDIWSLGCTLYYLRYGKQLIPRQPSRSEGGEAHRRIARRQRELKAICELFDSSAYLNKVMTVTDYEPSRECRLFDKSAFNDLLISMLRVNPLKRPSAEDLLRSDLFNNYPIIILPYNTYQLNDSDIPDKYVECINKMCLNNNELNYSALRLTRQVWDLNYIVPPLRLIRAVVSIVYRILYNGIVKSDYESIPEDEDIILNYTGFRILSIIRKLDNGK